MEIMQLNFQPIPLVEQMLEFRKIVTLELVPKLDELIVQTFAIYINPVIVSSHV